MRLLRRYLDDVAIHHLIDALCKLSSESMELAYNNREPSLFAVSKIHETGLVNLDRVEVLWRPLTSHLLEVRNYPSPGVNQHYVRVYSLFGRRKCL